MACGNMDLLAALEFVKDKRPVCSPNEGFMEVLLDLEAELFQKTSLDIEVYREDRFSSSAELCSWSLRCATALWSVASRYFAGMAAVLDALAL